ncbi:MAG TPA: hypothetical protein DEP88_02090 [Verrucomicrobiales bacterium]|jgi:hypothetical protein|nr:hypothetical protein [Verrucomicrobiales bacterium]
MRNGQWQNVHGTEVINNNFQVYCWVKFAAEVKQSESRNNHISSFLSATPSEITYYAYPHLVLPLHQIKYFAKT